MKFRLNSQESSLKQNSAALKKLYAAILQEAITDYLTGSGEKRDLAQAWLYGKESISAQLGFSYVCKQLQFKERELRSSLERQRQSTAVVTH
ncbi:MAG: hypothetical protein PHC51_14195 [bacterium]|nr:hypothetical protein [bacterium]